MNKKYKISEIAKMFNISRTALIHYDHCGLLKPSFRNEKKYRLYSDIDIQKLELILALKESGLTLGEIQSYLDGISDMTSIELLETQKVKIKEKINSLKLQYDIIDKRIIMLNKFKEVQTYEGIVINEYPFKERINEPIGFGLLMDYESAVNRLQNKLSQKGILTSKFGICFDITHTDSSGNYLMKYVFDYLSDENSFESHADMPKTKYICCIHKGQKTQVGETIREMINFAQKHELNLVGTAYYIPLFDYWESMTETFMGEVLMPVE